MGFETLIPAAATLFSTVTKSDDARRASASQQTATDSAIAEQRRQFDLARDDQTPYRAAGTQALGQLQTGLDSNPTAAEVMSGPGYQFGLQQGQQALDRQAAAAGGRVSGAALKGAAQYATDYATTGYNAEYQRRQDRLNRLASLAGIGQTATQASAASGANTGNQISSLLTGQGNATGAAQIAQGNIWGNGINQIGAIASKWARQPAGGLNTITNGDGFDGLPDYLKTPG